MQRHRIGARPPCCRPPHPPRRRGGVSVARGCCDGAVRFTVPAVSSAVAAAWTARRSEQKKKMLKAAREEKYDTPSSPELLEEAKVIDAGSASKVHDAGQLDETQRVPKPRQRRLLGHAVAVVIVSWWRDGDDQQEVELRNRRRHRHRWPERGADAVDRRVFGGGERQESGEDADGEAEVEVDQLVLADGAEGVDAAAAVQRFGEDATTTGCSQKRSNMSRPCRRAWRGVWARRRAQGGAGSPSLAAPKAPAAADSPSSSPSAVGCPSSPSTAGRCPGDEMRTRGGREMGNDQLKALGINVSPQRLNLINKELKPDV
uniref:Uncharacterized protein n=1 Tax=Oryza punctata TaxID=4537 RepID=A0A0E0K1S7_ORYPU